MYGHSLHIIIRNINLIANLTVKENVELGKELSISPLNINEVIKSVGLDDQKNKYP